MKVKGGAGVRDKEDVTGAPSVAEERRIRALINRHKRPQGVLAWNAEYGEDATGEPAVWVRFHYNDSDGISEDKGRELANFVAGVRSDLLDNYRGRWPYVGFRNPPA